MAWRESSHANLNQPRRDSGIPMGVSQQTLWYEAPDACKAVGVDLENIQAAIDVQIKRVGGHDQ
jgi:hypothetical protein